MTNNTAGQQITDERRYRLSPAELDATRTKITKINNHAIKRGFTGRLELDVRGPHTVNETNEAGLPVEKVVYDVTLTGEPPKINGWSLLAVLDFDPHAGLITRCAPGVDTIDRTDLREGWCGHCGTARARRKIYLVGTDAGEQVQVGSSCLKDFLGHNASVVFLDEESVTDDLFGELMTGPRDIAFSTGTVLGAAWACIKAFGWKPASSYGVTTREQVRAVLDPHGRADRELAAEIGPLIPDMAEKAAQVRDFITSDDFAGHSEYVVNLKAVIGADEVSARNFGLLVSAPQAWARHTEQTLIRLSQRAAAANSQHVGAIRDKIERDLTLTSIRYIENLWGTTNLYTFTDASGNLFKWFSSRDVLDDCEGETVSIRGTVVEHDEYQGVKQTVLTRCKVLTVVDRLGRKLVTDPTEVDGHTARSVLRATEGWSTREDEPRSPAQWLEHALAAPGELDLTQRLYTHYHGEYDLHITRTANGTVHAELLPTHKNG